MVVLFVTDYHSELADELTISGSESSRSAAAGERLVAQFVTRTDPRVGAAD
jgi:hypothetical protein